MPSEVLARFFVPGGIPTASAFRNVPMFSAAPAAHLQALAVVVGFVEVFLAREGHDALVGINFLEKGQLPTPAMLTARCWPAWTTFPTSRSSGVSPQYRAETFPGSFGTRSRAGSSR